MATTVMEKKDTLELPFSMAEYRTRLKKVQAELAKRGVDMMMIHTPENSYYLSGYRTIGYYSSMMLMVPVEGDPVHLTRLIEKSVLQGTSWVPNSETYEDSETFLDAAVRVLRERGWDKGRIGIDKTAWYLTLQDYEFMAKNMPAIQWVDCSLLVDTIRLVKSPAEQQYSRRAAQAACAGMRSALAVYRPGITEDDLMAAAYQGLFSKGSEFPALPPLINSGVRHTMAHAMAEGNPIVPGDVANMEIGGSIKRYHAAVLRMVSAGQPPKLFYDLFDMCKRSLDAALAKMQPGVPAEEVDRAARKVITDAGYEHRAKAGYNFGIAYPPDWSEARCMMLRGGEKRPLLPGMIYHVLPVVFEYKKYGVGLSETVLITENGHEILTDIERKWFVK